MFPKSLLKSSEKRPAEFNLNINLFTVDAAEYTFDPAGFDLIVLFYHLDRGLFPKIVSALNPSGLFICKMAVHWGSETASAKTLHRNELLSVVPGLEVIDHHERPARDRGVVEFAGRKGEFRKG